MLPRQNFAHPIDGALTVLQIILLEGWTQIFERGVDVAGLWLTASYFLAVLLLGRYVVGAMAAATVINGYNQEQVAERRRIRQEAVKEYRMQLLKREFREKLIKDRIAAANQKPPDPPPPDVEVAESRMANRHLRFQAVNVMVYKCLQEIAKNEKNLKKPLQVVPFIKLSQNKRKSSKQEAEESDDEGLAKVSLIKNIRLRRPADDKDAGDNLDMPNENLAGMKEAEKTMDLELVRANLNKMSEIDQEMYLRDGLNVIDLGKHVATNLQAVVKIHEDRIVMLQAQADVDKGNAAYYRQLIIPIQIKLQQTRLQIAGLRFGFQTGNSLWMFPPLHPVRVLACRIAYHPYSNRFALVLVFFSCFCVAYDMPGITQEERRWLSMASSAVNLLFLLELAFKIIGLNFQVYISDGFHRLDSVIVLSSIVDEVLKHLNLKGNVAVLAILPIVRSFRILRLLSRVEGLVFIVQTLSSSIVPLFNTMMVGLVVCFLFALLGLQLLIGKMHYCSDPLVHLESECTGKEHIGMQQRLWLNSPSHFDWIGRAFASVYQMYTGANWNEAMYQGIDTTEQGSGPSRNNSPTLGVFFICLVMFGKYLLLTLWTAILVDAFKRATIWKDVIAAEEGKAQLNLGIARNKPRRKEVSGVGAMVRALFSHLLLPLIFSCPLLLKLPASFKLRTLLAPPVCPSLSPTTLLDIAVFALGACT